MHFIPILIFGLFGLAIAEPSPVNQEDTATRTLDKRGSPTGINNRGSSNCKKGAMSEILGYLQQIPDTQIYKDGEHIACSGIHSGVGGGTCAFPQGTGGLAGWEIKLLINSLANWPNTQGCGSVPVTFPPELGGYNNFGSEGMLTVNYVKDTDNPCPPGVCGGTCS